MKKVIIIFTALLSVVSVQKAYSQDAQEALAYMKDLTASFDDVKSETWHYLKAVTSGKKARKVENKRQALIQSYLDVKREVSVKRPYKGDNSYRKGIIEYMELNYIVLKQDYDKILDMEEISEQSYDLMEAYLLAQERASEKLREAGEMLVKAENDFATSHNIKLMEGEADNTSKKIEKASATLSYYNDVYLIFFKCYKQEMYVIDALNKGDVNALEQNNNTLKAFSEEGLQKLKSTKEYNGDGSLKESCIKMLNFYKNEAEKEYPTMVDFMISKDNFEKIQKSFDAISKKKRTQQDIDKYNGALNTYNAAIPKYNSSLETTNTQRTKNLEEWNKKVEKFFSHHSK